MKVLLFGGTTEGRKFAEAITASCLSDGDMDTGIELCHVCVATEYGASLLPHNDRMIIHHERMDAEAIAELIDRVGFDVCVDATHPYAVLASGNIKDACDLKGVRLYRLLRGNTSGNGNNGDEYNDGRIRCFNDMEAAVTYLKGTKGNILASTGSKELKEFTRIEDYRTRVFARVLPVGDVVKACEELGFSAGNLYCMQGPFSIEMNIAMINACKAEHVVTKASGSAGGFDEKLEAAMRTGAELVVIGRPAEVSQQVYSFDEIASILGLGIVSADSRKAYVIGTGCGDAGLLTVDAIKAIESSECLIGAQRMLDNLGVMSTNKKIFQSYDREEIGRYLTEKKPGTVALLYSGDIGFFSGASKIEEVLDGYEIVRIPGISSGTYFCDRLGISWQDIRFLSCHGRKADISENASAGSRLLILLGEREDAGRICSELCKLDFENARVFIGEKLSYPDEKITEGTAEELQGIVTDPLSVMIILC